MQTQLQVLPHNSPCSKVRDFTHLLKDHEVLLKAVHIQSCLIYGHRLQAILQSEIPFISEMTNCHMMAICLNQQGRLRFEFMLDGKKQILKGLKGFKIKPHQLNLSAFFKRCRKEISQPDTHMQLDGLTDFFEGVLTKKQSQTLEQKLRFKKAFVLPIMGYEGEHIGYSIFVFQQNQTPVISNLSKINALFQTVIQPLYDTGSQTFYSKCTRVCTDMPLLTETEKRIIKNLLEAKSYPKIAEKLNISLNTVKTHMKNIFAKYHVNSKLELYNKINKSGL
ncbi:helix-turn-helix transcriptional regulator [Thiomicrorhabdus chilensis]|uniref:helix-turn-helix transcriptional regulator n=1 Tax=Thiomicrorhabdus chilensis TaxID=63656 RepID=UPI00041302C2|nr:helix-turn-helix transcriptional regulator [Thiomicrorhabdus chilensis]